MKYAGPIVRRVEPALASVWVALSKPATVTLRIWEGRVSTGSGNVLNVSDPTPTLRIGDELHVALPLKNQESAPSVACQGDTR